MQARISVSGTNSIFGEVRNMKKAIAALLSVILVMSASITVFGAEKNDVEKKINSSAAFLIEEKYGANDGIYDLKGSKYIYLLLKSDSDISDFMKEYLQAVKAALDNNALTTIDDLGIVLDIFHYYGIDAENFEGYNLVELFKSTNPASISNPNYYAFAAEAAKLYGLDDFGKVLCRSCIDNYYTMDKGFDFYGITSDNNAFFVLTLSYYYDDFKEYAENALKLMEAYRNADGYYSTADWGDTSSNTDSTALALAAYSAAGAKEKADEIYDLLIHNFFDEETGAFTSAYNEYYATGDALIGLQYYLPVADKAVSSEEATTKAPETTAEKTENSTAAKKNDSKKSPATGNDGLAAASFAVFALAGAAIIISKKHKA